MIDLDYKIRTRLDGVIDGDSVHATLSFRPGDTHKPPKGMRLAGINAPECRGETRAAGLAAKAYLEALTTGREVATVWLAGEEKYGRPMVVLCVKESDGSWTNLNLVMVNAGHATLYSGGKR